MSEPDKHHYLPVFYLSGWSQLEGKVTRYYRPHQDVVASRIAPKHTGYEHGLYRLEGYGQEARNAIEKYFMASVVDSPASHVFDTLIERDISKLKPEHRRAWIHFVMSLHVRNPGKVEYIIDQANHVLRESLLTDPEEYDALRGEDDPPTLVEWMEQVAPEILRNIGKELVPDIILSQRNFDEINRMRWDVIDIGNGFPDLLTCDRPLYMSHGVMDERCLIILPLSPRFFFIATRRQTTFDRVMSLNLNAVTKLINETMVMQAEKYVYGVHDRHLQFIKNRLS